MMEKDSESIHNGSTGEPEAATMATLDLADPKTQNKLTFSHAHPVVNRIKSLLSNLKKKATENAGDGVSMETDGGSPSVSRDPSPLTVDVPDSERQDRPKVPLKQRSFLNPFLEMTAAAQGSSEEEVVRRSPSLFENVTIKLEKPEELTDQCSQDVPDETEHLETGLEVMSSMCAAIVESGVSAHKSGSDVSESVGLEKSALLPCGQVEARNRSPVAVIENNRRGEEGTSESQTKEKVVTLRRFISALLDEELGDEAESKTSMLRTQQECLIGDTSILSKPASSCLPCPGKNDAEIANQPAVSINSDTLASKNVLDGPSVSVTTAALHKSPRENGTCGATEETASSEVGLETLLTECTDEDRNTAKPRHPEGENLDEMIVDLTSENEDAAKQLREKYPLLWESAYSSGGNLVIGNESESDGLDNDEGSKKADHSCASDALEKSHNSTAQNENAAIVLDNLDGPDSDSPGDNQVSSEEGKSMDTSRVLAPSDCSNEKVSVLDNSEVTVINDDVTLPSVAGSGGSTGTGGNPVVEQSSGQVSSDQKGCEAARAGQKPCCSGESDAPEHVDPPKELEGNHLKNCGSDDTLMDDTVLRNNDSSLGSGVILDAISDSGQSLTLKDDKSAEDMESQDITAGGEECHSFAQECSEPKEHEVNLNESSSSGFMSIKIADVKTMNAEEFENVAAPAGGTVEQLSPPYVRGVRQSSSSSGVPGHTPVPGSSPEKYSAITVLGMSGTSGNVSERDTIIKCRYHDGKYHCLLCNFSITFSTSFAVHLHKHLHKFARVCTACFAAESSPTAAAAKDSPFNLTCPIVKSTMEALENSKRAEIVGHDLAKTVDNLTAVSPLSLSGLTPPGNILEPIFPGSGLINVNSEKTTAIGLHRESVESDESDCCIISAADDEANAKEMEIGSAQQEKSTVLPTIVRTPMIQVTFTPVVARAAATRSLSTGALPVPPTADFSQSLSTFSSTSPLVRPLNTLQHSDPTLLSYICKLEIAKGFYTCGFPKCNFSTSIESNLETHFIVSHSFERNFPCVYCGHKFPDWDGLLFHMKGHHNASKMFQLYRCCFQRCKFCSNNSDAFKQHFEIMHPQETKFSCIFCKEEHHSDNELIQHLNENLLKLTQCPYCLVRSLSRQLVLQHIRRQHPNEVRRVTVTSKTICSDMKKREPQASVSTPIHRCSACNYGTSRAGRFRKHLAHCVKAKNFYAMMASQSESTPSPGIPEKALQKQSSISEQSIGSCDTPEPSQGNGEIPEDTSDNEFDADSFRVYACSACELTYRSNSELDKHIKEYHQSSTQKSSKSPRQITTPSPSPSNEQSKYLCEKCGASFSDSSNLQKHKSDYHSNDSDSVAGSVEETGGLLLRCPKCTNFSTRTVSYFKRHLLKHPGRHVTMSKICRHCQFIGLTKESVLLHYSETHPEITKTEVDNMKLIFYGEKAACPVCDFTCSFQVEPIVNHMMKEHAGDHSALKKALEQLPDNDDSEMEPRHSLNDKFKCEYCKEVITHLSTFLKHVQCHFSGEKQFTFYKCACCHYQSDRKKMVSRHYKKKHAGTTSPPDYIRYVTLHGKLDSGRESSLSQNKPDDPEASPEQEKDRSPSPVVDHADDDFVMDTASDLYENPAFVSQDETDYMNLETENQVDGSDYVSGLLPPAESVDRNPMPVVPDVFVKSEPVEEMEQVPPDMPDGVKIERYHCEFCPFSADVMDEFESHHCDPHAALELPRVHDVEPDDTSAAGEDQNSTSDMSDDDDFESNPATSQKIGDEWECTKCSYRSQHRNKIKRHYRYKHCPQKPYICGYCNFSAVESGHVRRHCRSVHSGRPVSVVNCLKADEEELDPYLQQDMEVELPSDLDDHISQLGSYMFQCNICQYTSETHHLIERHLLCVHFKFHKYECKFCDFTAAEKGKIVKHCKQTHKGNIGFSMRKFDESKLPSKEPAASAAASKDEEIEDNVSSSSALKRQSLPSSGSVQKKAKLDDDNSVVLDALSKLYSEVRSNIASEEETERFYRCTACTYSSNQRWCVVRHASANHPDSNDFALVSEKSRRSDQRKSFSCKICGQVFSNYFDTKKHVLSVHFGYGIYNCKYCSTRGHTKAKMADHVRALHGSEVQEIIEYPDPLVKMNKKMHQFCVPRKQADGKYKCRFCQFTRPYATLVDNHLRKVHLNYLNPFKCLYCGYSAKCKDSVRAHHNKWHKNEPFTVVIVRAPDRQEMTAPPAPPEMPASSQRGKRLSSESSSLSEATPVAGPKKRKRESSESSSFSTSRSPKLKKVKNERNAEEVEKPKQPKSPETKVKSPGAGSQILKVKIGPKVDTASAETEPDSIDLSCLLCGKVMSQEYRLRTHLMVHLDYRPYVCSNGTCRARFIEYHSLRKHALSSHHSRVKYRYVKNVHREDKLEKLMKGEMVDLSKKSDTITPPSLKPKVKLERDVISPKVENTESSERERRVQLVTGDLGQPLEIYEMGKRTFSCPHCDFTHEVKASCRRHMGYHAPRNVKCCYCNYRGHFPSIVKDHWSAHHEKDNKPFAFIKVSANAEKDEQEDGSSDGHSERKAENPVEQASPMASPKGSSSNRRRNFVLVKDPLGTPVERVRNKRRVFSCPHCDHDYEDKSRCNRHIQLHGPKIFKCKCCNLYGVLEVEMMRHCLQMHGKRDIIRLSREEAIAWEEAAEIDQKNKETAWKEEDMSTGQEEADVGDSQPEDSHAQKAPVNEKSAHIMWITQQLGWPKVVKTSKFRKKKWICQLCSFQADVKTVVVKHMESHLKQKYPGCSVRDGSNDSQEKQGSQDSGSSSLYAKVIRELGRPKLVRVGITMSKKWKCQKCGFFLKSKVGVLKHMESHLEETEENDQEKKRTSDNRDGPNTSGQLLGKEQAADKKDALTKLPEIKKVRKQNGTIWYRCQKQNCMYESQTRHNTVLHFNTKHGPKRYMCAYCEYKAHYLSDVKKHVRTHRNRPFRYLSINESGEFTVHGPEPDLKASPYQLKRFMCAYCEYRCQYRSDISRHVLTHRNNPFKYLSINESGETTVHDGTETKVKTSPRKQQSTDPSTSGKTQNDNSSRKEYPTNEVYEGGELINHCPCCSYSSETWVNYKKHYKRHIQQVVEGGNISDVNYQCHIKLNSGSLCGRLADDVTALREHYSQQHRGEKMVIKVVKRAKEAGSRKSQRSNIPVPTLPRPDAEGVYHCTSCDYTASERRIFWSHWRAHVRGYTCTICGFMREYLSVIERHVTAVHKETDVQKFILDNAADALKGMAKKQVKQKAVYKCPKCTYTSYSRLDYALHISLHISPKKKEDNLRTNKMTWPGWSPRPWECGYCHKTFFVHNKAKSHCSKCHTDLPMKINRTDANTGTSQNHRHSSLSPQTRTHSGSGSAAVEADGSSDTVKRLSNYVGNPDRSKESADAGSCQKSEVNNADQSSDENLSGDGVDVCTDGVDTDRNSVDCSLEDFAEIVDKGPGEGGIPLGDEDYKGGWKIVSSDEDDDGSSKKDCKNIGGGGSKARDSGNKSFESDGSRGTALLIPKVEVCEELADVDVDDLDCSGGSWQRSQDSGEISWVILDEISDDEADEDETM